MWERLLEVLFQLVSPALGALLVSFLQHFQTNPASDPVLVNYARGMVAQMEATGLTGEQKWQGAFDAIKGYAHALGLEIKDAAVNVLIELAVHALPPTLPAGKD